jgi:hypothetical protein
VVISLMVVMESLGLAPYMVNRGHFPLDKPCTKWYYMYSDDDKRG